MSLAPTATGVLASLRTRTAAGPWRRVLLTDWVLLALIVLVYSQFPDRLRLFDADPLVAFVAGALTLRRILLGRRDGDLWPLLVPTVVYALICALSLFWASDSVRATTALVRLGKDPRALRAGRRGHRRRRRAPPCRVGGGHRRDPDDRGAARAVVHRGLHERPVGLRARGAGTPGWARSRASAPRARSPIRTISRNRCCRSSRSPSVCCGPSAECWHAPPPGGRLSPPAPASSCPTRAGG